MHRSPPLPQLRLAGPLAAALLLCAPALAHAAITVSDTNDSGPGSLRQSIAEAPAGETIVLPAGTYTLLSGELSIAKSLTLSGAGPQSTIVRSGGPSRVLSLTGATSAVAISGLTIRDGDVNGAIAQGAGVLNGAASLSLSNVVVTENRLDADGAPKAAGGIAQGAGVYSEGVLTIAASRIVGNDATAVGGTEDAGGIVQGGGIFAVGDHVSLANTTIANNLADARGGQGPFNAGQSGGIAQAAGMFLDTGEPSAVAAVTISGNVADAAGGPGGNGGVVEGAGVFSAAPKGPLTFSDATIAANQGLTSTNGVGLGGGIFTVGTGATATVQITNATIAANVLTGGATSEAGNLSANEWVRVENTIVSAGVAGAGSENCAKVGSAPVSLGHNVEDRDQCAFHAAGDRTNVDPQLGPLQDNGGPVQTRALSPTSPAIDAGDASVCPGTDARGVARPQGAACDVGAFELAPPMVATSAASAIGERTATLNGAASNPDVLPGTVFFQWGTATTYGSQTSARPLPAGDFLTALPTPLTELTPATTYHFRVVAVNPDGTTYGADQTFATLAGALAPTLSRLSIRPARVLPERGRGPSIATAARRTRGTTIAYSDSQAATTTLTVLGARRGYRAGGSCRPRPPRTGKLVRCTRYVKIGSFTHGDRAGANSLRFTGRVNRRALPVGRYRLRAVARNAAHLASAPRSVDFRIVR